MTSLQVHLLDKPAIFDNSKGLITIPAKAQELFFYLLLHGNRPQEREALATILWDDLPSDRARTYLRRALWQLQNVLDPYGEPDIPPLLLDGSWVQLGLTSTIWLDIDQLATIFSQVRDIDGATLDREQVAQIQVTVASCQGNLLTGWYQDWCIVERERYQSMFLTILDKLIDYCITQAQLEQGIDYANQLLKYDQARERTHRRLMRLYYLANDRTAALRQFKRCTDMLAQELDVEPSNRTRSLYDQIREDKISNLRRTSARVPYNPENKAEPVLTELRQIKDQLAALQHDIQRIKSATDHSKNASVNV